MIVQIIFFTWKWMWRWFPSSSWVWKGEKISLFTPCQNPITSWYEIVKKFPVFFRSLRCSQTVFSYWRIVTILFKNQWINSPLKWNRMVEMEHFPNNNILVYSLLLPQNRIIFKFLWALFHLSQITAVVYLRPEGNLWNTEGVGNKVNLYICS